MLLDLRMGNILGSTMDNSPLSSISFENAKYCVCKARSKAIKKEDKGCELEQSCSNSFTKMRIAYMSVNRGRWWVLLISSKFFIKRYTTL